MERVKCEVMYANDNLVSLSEECLLSVEGGTCVSVNVNPSGVGCVYVDVEVTGGCFCPGGRGIFCNVD